MAKQTEAIRTALGEPMITEFDVEIRAALCFVNAELVSLRQTDVAQRCLDWLG